MDRRKLIYYLTGAASACVCGLFGAIGCRFFSSQVSRLGRTMFRLAQAKDYPVNSITYFEEMGLFLFRKEEGFFAISNTCPHLGCKVKQRDEGFVCHCHGSYFDQQGKVLTGPSPRHLAWYKISQDVYGMLVIDRKEEVKPGTLYSPLNS